MCIGTKRFNDKTTHRQQAKHSVKTGFVWEWENRIPGLLQDFFIFQGLNFFPILYSTMFKSALFQPEASKCKGALDFFESNTGEKKRDYRTNWMELNTSCTSLFDVYLAIFTQFLRFSHSFFCASNRNLKGLVVFLYFSKTNSYFQG